MVGRSGLRIVRGQENRAEEGAGGEIIERDHLDFGLQGISNSDLAILIAAREVIRLDLCGQWFGRPTRDLDIR